jgi:hypothetical protein
VLHPVKKKKNQISHRVVASEEQTEAIVNIHECTVLNWVQWLCNHRPQRRDNNDSERKSKHF